MSALRPGAAWRAQLAAAAHQPPRRVREALHAGGVRVGSVEPDLFARAGLLGTPWLAYDPSGWHIAGQASAQLAEVADALRRAGLAHVWRNETLAVCGPSGEVVGAVERAVVRPLGIATRAVHMAGVDEAGRHWVQQRSLTKANDPGLWDTLVGGMVAASDTPAQALERETWEEAGLRLGQLRALRRGGHITSTRPASAELPHGYVVEQLDWYVATVPEGVEPVNQDGEVDCFARMQPPELTQRLERGEFTIDAGLVLLAAFGA